MACVVQARTVGGTNREEHAVHPTTSPAVRTVADIDAELKRLAEQGDRFTDAHWQLRTALAAYREHRGHDLTGATVELVDVRLDELDSTYNYTPATSIEQYTRQFDGRLTGEDLDWQVYWYTALVAAAAAGQLPPLLVHDVGGRLMVVDGGHRASAHRTAGLDTAPAYLVRG